MRDTPAFPDGFLEVAPASAIPEGQAKALTVGRDPVAVFNLGGEFYAIRDECPHQFAKLSEGRLKGFEVVCALHGWRVDVRDGSYSVGNDLRIDSYETHVADGVVYVAKTPRPHD